MKPLPSPGSDIPALGREHHVELERYSGPLDLLLWLIRQEEVGIHDIPISRILDRYLEVLKTLQFLDLDQAGEFLVMASTLMRIKSRSLLPTEDPLDDEDLDPRFDLVRKLLEYRKFKDISEELRSRAEDWAERYPPGRAPELPGTPPDEIPLTDISLWDLAEAFNRIIEEVGVDFDRTIIYDDVPIEVHMEQIVTRLERETRVQFAQLFAGSPDRAHIAGLFLALLELIKQNRARAFQEKAFAPIEILLNEEPGEEAEQPPAPSTPSDPTGND